MTVEAQKTRDPDQMQTVYLEKLADELSHRGLEAWLMAPPGRVPSLYVVNPSARALEITGDPARITVRWKFAQPSGIEVNGAKHPGSASVEFQHRQTTKLSWH